MDVSVTETVYGPAPLTHYIWDKRAFQSSEKTNALPAGNVWTPVRETSSNSIPFPKIFWFFAVPKTEDRVCKNACIACGICVRACPEAIILEKNLAVITDFKKIKPEQIPEIEKCPTNAIGRLRKDNDG
jgi:ferredoxin